MLALHNSSLSKLGCVVFPNGSYQRAGGGFCGVGRCMKWGRRRVRWTVGVEQAQQSVQIFINNSTLFITSLCEEHYSSAGFPHGEKVGGVCG